MSFFRAFFLPLRAFALIRKTPALWRLSAIAALLCAVTLVGLFVALVMSSPALLALLWAKPAGILLLLWYPAVLAVFALCFVLGAQILPVVMLAPLGDKLSFETEKALRQVSLQGGLMRFAAETARAVSKSLVRVSLLLGGQAALLPLWFVPGAGHVAWSVLSTGWSMSWIAFEYVDLTANRHGLGFFAVLKLLARNLLATVGVGGAIYLLMFVPILNFFFFPIAVVSGALWFIDRTS